MAGSKTKKRETIKVDKDFLNKVLVKQQAIEKIVGNHGDTLTKIADSLTKMDSFLEKANIKEEGLRSVSFGVKFNFPKNTKPGEWQSEFYKELVELLDEYRVFFMEGKYINQKHFPVEEARKVKINFK